jgi:hypothetical protein
VGAGVISNAIHRKVVAMADRMFRRMAEENGVPEILCRAHFRAELRPADHGHGMMFRVVPVYRFQTSPTDRIEGLRTWAKQHDEFR